MLRQVVSAGTLLNPAKLQRFLNAFVKLDLHAERHRRFPDRPGEVVRHARPAEGHLLHAADGPEDPTDPDALALDPKATAVFDALINDQTLPGEPTVTTSSDHAQGEYQARRAQDHRQDDRQPTAATPTLTVAPADVDLEVVNVAGRAGVAGEAQTALNAVGFDVTDDDLTLPEDQPVYQDITVLYAPANRAAARDRGGRGTRRDPGGARTAWAAGSGCCSAPTTTAR